MAGAHVRVIHLDRGADFIKDFLWQPTWAGLSTRAATDKDGEFTLTGLGVGRTGLVLIEGPTIGHRFEYFDTRGKAGGEKAGLAPTGDQFAKPTKPIEGTIVAKDTGKPLAGVIVYGNEDAYKREVRAVTDRNGRYRLVGLPKAAQYKLTVYCPWGLSYLGRSRELADSEGLKPITANFELRRGIPVEFRLIDKETRRPVRGTTRYTPMSCNPLYGEAGGRAGVLGPNREMQRIYMADPRGVFRLVVYPGRGMIAAFVKFGRPYLPARLTPDDEKKEYLKGEPFLEDMLLLSEGYRILDTDQTDKPLTFDIELDPGRTVKGSLLGPDGKPVLGATAHGLSYNPIRHRYTRPVPSEKQLLESSEFAVTRIDPRESRTVSFLHPERKLIGHAVLRSDEKGPLTVRLEPWGTLTGRLVDEQGKPLADVRVGLSAPSLPEPGPVAVQEFRTDRDGRFRVEGLLPGLKHELTLTDGARKKVSLASGDQLQGLAVPAGAVKDVGDIAVKVAPAPKKENGND